MLAFLCRDAHLPAIGDSDATRKQGHDEKSRFSWIDNDIGCDLRTGICTRGSNTPYRPEVTGRSDRQVGHAFNAFDPVVVTQTVEPNAHRYHGGPKSNY